MSTYFYQYYEAKIIELKKYLPMIQDIIHNLKQDRIDGAIHINAFNQHQNVLALRRDMHLRRMATLFELLTDKNKM